MKSETNKAIIALIVLSLIFFSISCSSKIDKNKFRELRKSAGAIDKSVEDTALPYAQFEQLLQKLTDEISKTKALAGTEEEKALLSSYVELLMTYQDGAMLWEYKIGSAQYAWIPKGRIYVDTKLRPIMEKYHFPAESNVNELTNFRWESISADSLNAIWEKAHEQIRKMKF